jgi:hypothetical protein
MRVIVSRTLWLALPLAVAGCVKYQPAPIDPVSLSHAAATPPPGPLAWEAAVAFALANNPELLALRARTSAINHDLLLEELGGESSDDISVDVIGLLRLGESGTKEDLARAQWVEAGMRHRERAWEVAAAIAEAYEVDRALAALTIPEVALPAEAYVKAGLAPESARDASDAIALRVRAETTARDEQRRRNRVELLRLLGARPDAALVLGDGPAIPPPAEPRPGALLVARPDLWREMATYRVADREFRRSVAEQYPQLLVDPPFTTDFSEIDVFDVFGFTVPLRAPAEAKSAWKRREAARLEAKAAVLDALADVAAARSEVDETSAGIEAARRRSAADAGLLRTARARLEAEAGSFLEAVFAGEAWVDSTEDLREAAVADARARVHLAKALGWPKVGNACWRALGATR